MTNQSPGVDSGDDGDATGYQELLCCLVRAPIARKRRKLAHHQTFDIRLGGFAVRCVRAIVTDLRVGEDYDLAGVGRVREHFLITGDRGIENDFTRTFDRRTKTVSLEDCTVFQGE